MKRDREKQDKYVLSPEEMAQYFIAPVLYILLVGVLSTMLRFITDGKYIFIFVAVLVAVVYVIYMVVDIQNRHNNKDNQ